MNRSFSKIRHIQEVNSLLEKRMLTEQAPTGTTNANVAVDATKKKEIYNQDLAKIRALMPYTDKQLVDVNNYLHQQPSAVDYIDKQVYTPYAKVLQQINPNGYSEGLKSNWKRYTSMFVKPGGQRMATDTPTGVANGVINDLISAKKYAIALTQQKAGYAIQPQALPQGGYNEAMKSFLKNIGVVV